MQCKMVPSVICFLDIAHYPARCQHHSRPTYIPQCLPSKRLHVAFACLFSPHVLPHRELLAAPAPCGCMMDLEAVSMMAVGVHG